MSNSRDSTGDTGAGAEIPVTLSLSLDQALALAEQHLQAGRHLDAQVCCQRALALAPDDADSLHLAGLLAYEAGGNDDAMEWFSRAIGQTAKPEYLTSLGAVLQRLKRLDEALQAFPARAAHEPVPGVLALRRRIGGGQRGIEGHPPLVDSQRDRPGV